MDGTGGRLDTLIASSLSETWEQFTNHIEISLFKKKIARGAYRHTKVLLNSGSWKSQLEVTCVAGCGYRFKCLWSTSCASDWPPLYQRLGKASSLVLPLIVLPLIVLKLLRTSDSSSGSSSEILAATTWTLHYTLEDPSRDWWSAKA